MAYAEQVGFAEIIERLPSYDASAAALLTRCVLEFLRSR
jgi:hypothetical protein